MALIAALIASLAAGLAGAAVYLTFVEHPARVSCGSALAVTELGPSYKRATSWARAPGSRDGRLAADSAGSSAAWCLVPSSPFSIS